MAREAGDADDAELVRRARRADPDAFVAIVHRHQGAAIRLARALGPAADAEDAVQEAFVKAHQSLRRFDTARPLRPWLLAIVANEARSGGRRSRRASGLTDRVAALDPPASQAASAEQVALDRIAAGPLIAALDGLGRRERETLVLRFVLDHSEAETAQILGCAQGTVKSRSARGLARLRSQLQEAPS